MKTIVCFLAMLGVVTCVFIAAGTPAKIMIVSASSGLMLREGSDATAKKIDTIPLADLVMGTTFSFKLNQDELADEMEISLDSDNGFEGKCYLHGSGEAKFNGRYAATEINGVLTLVLNGALKGLQVAERERRFERKIANTNYVIRKKGEVFYGTLAIPPCQGFTSREMETR